MALFDFTRRRTDIDDAMRSTDSTLNVFVLVLLVAAALGTWYFYWQTPNDISTGAPTITTPAIAPPAPDANPTRPTASPNPGP